LPLLIPEYEFRGNRGLEAIIAVAPTASPLSGAVVAISERESRCQSGDIYAAILTGPSKGVFFVKRDPPFDVTDGDFPAQWRPVAAGTPVLDRSKALACESGSIDGSRLGPGNLVDGPKPSLRPTTDTRSTTWKAST
jgi:hypothetical protein